MTALWWYILRIDFQKLGMWGSLSAIGVGFGIVWLLYKITDNRNSDGDR